VVGGHLQGKILVNLVGQTFGRWKVVALAQGKRPPTKWVCKCECGSIRKVRAGSLLNGHTQSCGCLRTEITSAVNRLRPFESRYNQLVGRCQAKNRKVMSYQEYLTFTTQRCYYCHSELSWNAYRRNGYAGSNLDRVDSNKGYTKANCVACCGQCNTMKMAMSQSNFIAKVVSIYNIHGGSNG